MADTAKMAEAAFKKMLRDHDAFAIEIGTRSRELTIIRVGPDIHSWNLAMCQKVA